MWIQEPVGYDKHAFWGISHCGRKRQQFYGFAVNREYAHDVYSKRRIIAVTKLKIVEWHNYKHLDWITVCKDDDNLYKVKEGDFKRLRIQDIEDMLLFLVKGKLRNLTIKERFAFNKKLNLTRPDTYRSDLKRKEAYTAYSNPRGFIYQNKDKQNRLMRIDELHKFSDGTLIDVRTALDYRLKGIRMKYLPQTIWMKSDKERAAAMIQAIDKQLKTRRIMRSLERRRDDDADKDEEPSAGSDRGPKRRRERKKPESASAPKEKATRSTGKSTQASKSRQTSASESTTTEDPMQTTHKMEEPSHPEFETGRQYPHNLLKPLPLIPNSRGHRVILFDHFTNNDLEYLRRGASSRKYTTSVTKTKAADYEHIKWIEDLVPRTIIITVTKLKIVELHNYKHLDWITVRRDDDNLYKVKEGDFKRLRIQDIEDMRVKDLQLGVESYQKKLNLTRSDTYRFDLKRKEAYTAYSNPRGFIYQNKDKQNSLMRIDELHKFSDGTLTDVRTALDYRLKGIRMKYLPQTIWMKSDKETAAAMIQAIDKQLKTRRIMRSLERLLYSSLLIDLAEDKVLLLVQDEGILLSV
nr:hypothetical protein [Tanacetum cinerariifolium]